MARADASPSSETSPVLAMLAKLGISPGRIAAAARGARDQGVTVADYLTGNGYVSADTLYRGVARHLGMPFIGGNVPLRENIDPYAAARRGVAPIVQDGAGGARIVVAPRGPALERLMSGAHPAENLRAPRALTTPDRLEHALRTHAAVRLACDASEALGKLDPILSVRSGPTSAESGIALVCLCALAVIALIFPLLAGTCLAVAFFAAILLRLFSVAMSFGPAAAAPRLADADLPLYTIIVALYREEAVIAQLLAALERLDYPHAKLDTKIVVEADDAGTIAALHAAGRRFPFEMIIAPPGSPRTKPRALNVALPFARGALTCVFDAEDKPERSQLRRAAEIFATSTANLACLQARLVTDNYRDNWLTRLYALDYATLFEVIVPGLARLALPIPLGGTSNHFRTAALRAVGGWDAWNVTEDADLGLRLARFGYQVGTLDSETLEEVPAAVPAFLRQRTRWIKGWMQTLFINARNPRRLVQELGFVSAICTVTGLGSAVLGALFWPIFGLLLLWNVVLEPLPIPQSTGEVLHSTLWCFNAGFGVLAIFGAIAIGMRRQKLGGLWPWLVLWPAYQALVTIAAWRAIFELWRDPFGWAKTEHGLARSSRSEFAI
jgi:cellulose synthase/poly-beta-1,6-N-acetylglucosamine synthase-like glycosyltransferase